MEPKDYIVAKIEGEYATLKNILDGGEIFIAMALLPEGVDMLSFCSGAVQKMKVAVVPGSAFSINDEECRSFRVNFSTPTNVAMTRGVQNLGVFAREFLNK